MTTDEIIDATGRVWRKHGPQWWVHDGDNGITIYRTAAALQTELRKAARDAKP